MPSETIVVLCTLPDQEVAAQIAAILVQEQLAACINIIPALTSVYRWKGTVHQDNEVLLLIKSNATTYPQLEQRIQALHPYELPEIIAVPIQTGQADYIKWINENLIPFS